MPTPVAWSPSFDFNFRNADGQTQIKFVQLRNGDFWVVWTDFKDTLAGSPAGTDLVGQRYNALGERQGPEVRLNSNFTIDNERNADLAADVGSDEFFMVYEDLNADGSIDLILEHKGGAGTSLGFIQFALDLDNTAGGFSLRNPQIEVASATSGLIVFERTNAAGNTEIRGQFFDPSTRTLVGTAFTIAALATDAINPAITVTSTGEYAVAFQGNGDLNVRFIAQNGVMDPIVNPITGNNIRDLSIAPVGDGRVAVSYTNDADGINLLVLNSNGTIHANAGVISAGGTHGDSHVVRIDDDTVAVAWALGATGLRTVTYDLAAATLTADGGNTVFFGTGPTDIAMLPLADGRFLLGYANPIGQAQIRDPRDGVNATAVYQPDDMQIGTVGDDIFTAAAGANIVHGWDGNDDISDGAGIEALILGGEGNDTIRYSFVEAAESADGGPGTDTLVYTALAGTTVVNLAGGTATTGGTTQSVIGFENFVANVAQNISITGAAAGPSDLTTGGGNDSLDLGPGGGVMRGGAGNDTYQVDSLADLIVDSAGATDTVNTGLATYTLPTGIENLNYFGIANTVLTGNSGNNVINTGDGADLILLQQGGTDTANTGGGNDGIYFGATMTSADAVNAGAGTGDQIGLQGNYAALTLGANATVGVEFIVLLAGNDNRFGGATGTNLSYNLTTVDANIAAGQVLTFQANTLRAGENFTLNASAETNGFILTFGGFGTETITGGQQGDGFYFGTGRFNPADTVNGGGGSDQIGFQGDFAGANALTFGAGQLTSIEFLVFLSAADTRFGGGGGAGQNFSYTATTNNGNVAAGEQLIIQANTLRAGEVLTFNGSAELDGSFRVFSGAGNDVIVGGSQADEIAGGAGSDQITGRGGADVLRGGLGSDRFNYSAISDSTAAARDRILDFDGGDAIVLTNVDANSLVAGQQAFTLIGSGQAFTAAGQLRITQTGALALVEGDSNGDGAADFAIEVTMTGGLTLGAGSIFGLAPAAEMLKPFQDDSLAEPVLWRIRSDADRDFYVAPTSDLLI